MELEGWMKVVVYIVVLVFASLVIMICFGPGPNLSHKGGFVSIEEEEKKRLQEGLKIKKPKMNIKTKDLKNVAKKAVSVGKGAAKVAINEVQGKKKEDNAEADIDLPEKLKGDYSQYLKTVKHVKAHLEKMQKVELLLVIKESKDLIEDMNNKENELNKLIQ